jgi:quercetin dioxygenase-like cupin family protein
MAAQTVRLLRWDDIPQEQVNELLSRRLVSGEREMVAQITMKKGCFVPQHAHESEQITWVFKGALRFRIGGKEIVVGENEVLHIPSNVPHEAFALDETFEVDIFSPIRQDWLDKTDDYLRR